MTSDLFVGETWTILRRQAGHRPAIQFYEAALRLPILSVDQVDEGLQAEAGRWLR